MKTLIKNSEIQAFFEKTGTNLGITFDIVKDFHNCFYAITYNEFNKNKVKKSLDNSFIIPHATFKKIISFTGHQGTISSEDLQNLHKQAEKKMLTFLRFAKNKAINGHLLAVMRKTAKFTIKVPNFLWFVVEKRKRKSKSKETGGVRIVSDQIGAGKSSIAQKTTNLDLDEFNDFLLQNKLIDDPSDDDIDFENLDNHVNFLKWASKKIKREQLHK